MKSFEGAIVHWLSNKVHKMSELNENDSIFLIAVSRISDIIISINKNPDNKDLFNISN